MFDFLLDFMKAKNEQDTLNKVKDDAYNPALRETLKLLMNSLSGKVIEGLHTEKTVDVNSVAEYEKAADLSDGNAFVIGSLVSGYYLNGVKDKADMLFEKLKKRTETEYVPPTSFYLIHKFKGEEDLAFEWLKRACTEHDTFLPLFRITPNLIPESSRYIALLKEVGLVY